MSESPQRRLDDRIRILCAQARGASDEELEPILQELLELVHMKMQRLKRRAAGLLLIGEQVEPERRAGSGTASLGDVPEA